MPRKIIVYSYGDSRPKMGFPTEADFQKYIRDDIFQVNKGRHCYTQGKEADVIVLSRKGLVYGRFEIEDIEQPKPLDYLLYDRVKYVYIVNSSVLYGTLLRLKDFGIKGLQFGKYITEDKLKEIETRAAPLQSYQARG
jgi:hypothetical protein